MERKIPKEVKAVMADLGLNSCERYRIEGMYYYYLALVDDKGEPAPIGLPIVCEMQGDKAVILSPDDAINVTSKIQDNEE